jgi:hypothetical protein
MKIKNASVEGPKLKWIKASEALQLIVDYLDLEFEFHLLQFHHLGASGLNVPDSIL